MVLCLLNCIFATTKTHKILTLTLFKLISMKKNEKFVITINRELGSGGRTIGEKLGVKLMVPFYDKELIQQLKDQYHLTVEEIERLKGQKHNWLADFKRSMMMMPNYVTPQYIGTPNSIPDFLLTD